MSRVEQLPADQQAVLSLLVGRGRTYGQVAGVLGIDQAAVRRRAQVAVGELGGTVPSDLAPADAERIGDYLLGQQVEADRISTLVLLTDSAAARAWAREVAAGLAPIASVALPAVPDGHEPEPVAGEPEPVARETQPVAGEPVPVGREPEPEPDPVAREPEPEPTAAEPPPPSAEPRREVNRGGGVLLLAAALLIAAIVVFITDSGGSSAPARGPIPASAATSASTTGSSGILAEVRMTPPRAGGSATGAVAVVQNGSTREITFSASKLPVPRSGHYVLWLYDSSSHFEALGVVQSVKADGSVGPLAVTLPSDASSYHGVALTLETSSSPTSPGTLVLTGTSSSAL